MSRTGKRIFKSTADLELADIRPIYDGFNSPITGLDCEKKCALHNPGGKPFCCDICQAVPAAYKWQVVCAAVRREQALDE